MTRKTVDLSAEDAPGASHNGLKDGPVCNYDHLVFMMDFRKYDPPLWKYNAKTKECEEVTEGSGSWRAYGFKGQAACEAKCMEEGKGDEDKADEGKEETEGTKGPGSGTRGPGSAGMGLRPPWWILHGVKPEGPLKDMGAWKAVTFSKAQQDQFGVSKTGKALDKERFRAALKALKRPILFAEDAPAASRKGLKDGPVCSYDRLIFTRDLRQYDPPLWRYDSEANACESVTQGSGSWRAYAFEDRAACEAQCVERAEGGEGAVGEGKALKKPLGAKALPPWWILLDVKPNGKPKDMGTWMGISFSEEQQERFGVDEDGEVVDRDEFRAATAALKDKQDRPASV